MLKKKFGSKKTLISGLAAATLTLGLGFWTVKTRYVDLKLPAYQTQTVIDGDTFTTTEKQIVRLAGIQAPEKGNCYAEESTQELQKLVQGQKIYIKTIFTDSSRRLISLVYTPSGFVNEAMVKSGAAFVAHNNNYEGLIVAQDYAREHKLGVFSSKCLQPENPDNPKCNIKGNVFLREQDHKVYHLPNCYQYSQTLVQLAEGDRWFCTEAEAKKAGFTKSPNCPTPKPNTN